MKRNSKSSKNDKKFNNLVNTADKTSNDSNTDSAKKFQLFREKETLKMLRSIMRRKEDKKKWVNIKDFETEEYSLWRTGEPLKDEKYKKYGRIPLSEIADIVRKYMRNLYLSVFVSAACLITSAICLFALTKTLKGISDPKTHSFCIFGASLMIASFLILAILMKINIKHLIILLRGLKVSKEKSETKKRK